MKAFITNRAAHYLGRKLNGYKTRIAGIGTMLAGLVMTLNGVLQLIGSVYPDMGFEGTTPAEAIETITLGLLGLGGGFGVVGVGHKLEKEADQIDKLTHHDGA